MTGDLPGLRVGDASDAGGFVVPHGVRLGVAATVRFELDHDRSFTVPAIVVRRTSAHDLIFPVDGTQLGPARP